MSGDEFDWWFDGNPAGSLRSVAVLDGRVVGVAGHSLYRVVLEGEEAVASASVHAVTDPSARGRGIFVELERKHEREATERGVACVLAFASAPTAPLFLGPLGWTRDREAPRLGAAGVGQRVVATGVQRSATATRPPTGRTTSSATQSTCSGATSTRRAATSSSRAMPATPSSGRRSGTRGGRSPSSPTTSARPSCCARRVHRAQARFQFALPAPEQRRRVPRGRLPAQRRRR